MIVQFSKAFVGDLLSLSLNQCSCCCSGVDVTAISSALIGGSKHARACQAVGAMMSKGSINPADVTTLYTAYTSPEPPPVEMIRNPTLLSKNKYF